MTVDEWIAIQLEEAPPLSPSQIKAIAFIRSSVPAQPPLEHEPDGEA